MDWYARCDYAPDNKYLFHQAARTSLRALAKALRFGTGSFDLRSNAGGVAVSGEITLHHERVYVQVSQPATGWDSGILIRTCEGRRDYTGGHNHYAPLSLLDDIPLLARRVRLVMQGEARGYVRGTGAARCQRRNPPDTPVRTSPRGSGEARWRGDGTGKAR